MGGSVRSSKHREFGLAEVKETRKSKLTKDFFSKGKNNVWMSHADQVTKLPKNFKIIAQSINSKMCIIENVEKKMFGIQFHPEVSHTIKGKLILKNFIFSICKLAKNWSSKDQKKKLINEVRNSVGNSKVICALSGGVDSSVVAKLLSNAIGKKLTCIFVNTGLLRKGEENQVIIPLCEVELNKNYAMVITTNAGLWRYKIGDTIKFTSLYPYRIQITGRTKVHINVFGEELMIENAEVAMSKTANVLGLEIIDYTAGPIFMGQNKKGGHQWIVEFRKKPKKIDEFKLLLDRNLKNVNSDYEAKRYKDITLSAPKITIAKKDLFYQWMASKNKLGGQNKVPRLSNSREILEELLEMNT